MGLKLYNTLTRSLEEFKPIDSKQVGVYSCGPTVYWNQHIGHMYAYVQWDILVRFLRFSGKNVKWVMNITDVGHMTSDEDYGEDKLEKGAKREGLTVWEVAEKYTKQFLESLDLLNVVRPDEMPKATEHIERQIELIKKIEERGFTYKTSAGVVFDTGKFKGYPDFGNLDLDMQMAGSRVKIDPEKKNPWDFMLWVTNQPKHIMQWDSPWGRGFPGWHIECTAMSTQYLGDRFDIHTGGKEHIPVHHTNEIAQGYGAFGGQTANWWLHNDWLRMDGKKMSKSTGEFVTAQDLVKKGIDPLALRYLFLNSHYRKGMKFSWEALSGAEVALSNLREIVSGLKGGGEIGGKEKIEKYEKYKSKFIAALENDLNVPQALAVTWEVAKSNLPPGDKYDLLILFDEVLGLKLGEIGRVEIEIPVDARKLAERRSKLREKGEWAKADEVRKKLEKMGYEVRDVGGRTEIARKSLKKVD